MSTDPSTPPTPDPDHTWARRGVRWTIVSLVISTVIALVSLYVQASQSSDDTSESDTTSSSGEVVGAGGTEGTGDDPSPTPDDDTSDSPAPDPDPSTEDTSGTTDTTGTSDGLTGAEHTLRDSLNAGQWSRDSCTRALWPGSDAALFCTVTTTDDYGIAHTGKASVVAYATKSARDAVFQQYASRVQTGDCETQTNVYGSWAENGSPDEAAGDVVCYVATSGQYVFLCSYYDRPALVQIAGPDRAGLTAWWHTMEPVFTG
ncbi:hypothetical protein ACH4F6_12425 [Streptomyces sp. NPDC017936]|uniref:hypothetical protein n=1 Tax=Streptomyces sp. NPDC017936 TaxID=3365016 RepID=UPI0037991A05